MEIPGYDIQRLVAQGGTSSVFVAVQRSLGRQVALKILRPLDGSARAARFLEEGRIVASLNHRNVITIYDVGVLGGWYYIAMEYLEGGSLESRINGGVPPARALELLETIAACLDFVHRRGIIHRDIKPANILFHADGTVRLTDFGIAKQLSADQDLTLDGRALGSPYYLSPEQAECKPLDGRSDIYSLGIVLYELLTGRKPFAGASHIETIVAHLTRPAPRLPRHLAAFQDLIDLMVAKSPSARFGAAGELANYVRKLRLSAVGGVRPVHRVPRQEQGNEVVRPEAPSLPRSDLGQSSLAARHRGTLAAIVPVAVLLAVTAGLVGYRNQHGDEVSTSPPVVADQPAATAASRLAAEEVQAADSPRPHGDPAGVSQGGESSGERSAENNTQTENGPAAEPDNGVTVRARDAAASPIHGDTPVSADIPIPNADESARSDVLPVPTEAQLPVAQPSRVAEWLRSAEAAVRDYRLTTPRGNSAVDYYRAILDQDPDNPDAIAGLGHIADLYAGLARRRLDAQDRDMANTYVERGLAVHPGHAGLLELEAMLSPLPPPVVVEEPGVDGFTKFFQRVRAFVTHPDNTPNADLLSQ